MKNKMVFCIILANKKVEKTLIIANAGKPNAK